MGMGTLYRGGYFAIMENHMEQRTENERDALFFLEASVDGENWVPLRSPNLVQILLGLDGLVQHVL